MRYFVTVGKRTFEVDVAAEKISVNGMAVNAELLQVSGTPVRRLSIAGESHRVVAEKGDARGQWELHVDGYRVSAEAIDERTQALRAMTARGAGAQGPKPVKAPMPGMVVRVDVEPGDKVKAGQGVVIIEAMKMENELKAEAAGVVSKVAVEAGTAVEKGTVLIEFAAHD